jgi:hypothetical protein
MAKEKVTKERMNTRFECSKMTKTDRPIAGANMTCKHFSFTSKEADRCNRSTTTGQDGNVLFEDIFF